MKILFLSHEFGDFGGGAGNAARHIALSLVAEGHTVTCLTSNFNGRLPARETVSGIDVHRVPGWRHGPLDNCLLPTFAAFCLAGWVAGHRLCKEGRVDVMHAFFTVPAGLVGAWLSRQHGIPLVVSLRGSDVPFYVVGRRPSALHRRLVRRVWSVADRVVALSDGLLTTARKTAPLPTAAVIRNGVDAALFCAEPRSDDAHHEIRLVSACRLVRHKGLHVLLDALSRLADVERVTLCIAGDGPEREALALQARELGLERHVEFLGYVPHDDLPAVYRSADLFVLPSLTESFGQVVTEAMACGLPVLASCVGGVPEIVRTEAHGWLVPAGDATALSDALQAAISLGRGALQERGAHNSAYVAETFTWPGVRAQYESVYHELCHAGEGRP